MLISTLKHKEEEEKAQAPNDLSNLPRNPYKQKKEKKVATTGQCLPTITQV